VEINASSITTCVAPYELVKTMRASDPGAGPLWPGAVKAQVSLPRRLRHRRAAAWTCTCAGWRRWAPRSRSRAASCNARAAASRAARIVFDVVTVTGTENLLMAAALADGDERAAERRL